jgi:prepilin-type N-terminal cleavage/methylation domain-containing protein
MPRGHDRGYTVIELLVVISIIGILASVVLFALSKSKDSAKSSAVTANVKNYNLALQNYFSDNGTYPPLTSQTCIAPLSENCDYETTTVSPNASLNAAIEAYQPIGAGPTDLIVPGIKEIRGITYICTDNSVPGTCPRAVITYGVKGSSCILADATLVASDSGGVVCAIAL